MMSIIDLQRHADAGTLVNATGNYVNAYDGSTIAFSGVNDLSAGMKTFYNTALLENARGNLVHAQFGRKQGLPANNGKTIEWRKWNTLPKALKPLTEGVIPTGQKFGQTSMTTSISQHGMFVAVTDLLDLHHVDPVIAGATEELGASAGATEDTLLRNILLQGTNVMFAENGNGVAPNYRYELTEDCVLTPDVVHKAKTKLVKLKAPKIDNSYVAIIHPSVAYDLTKDETWVDFHKYAATAEIFQGEIGEIRGVRFVETTEAGIFAGTPLTASTRYATVSAYSGSASGGTATAGVATPYRVTVSETISNDLVGKSVNFQDVSDGNKLVGTCVIKGVNTSSKYIYLGTAAPVTLASGDFVVPGDGAGEIHAADGSSRAVDQGYACYATLFLGKDAFGIIDPAGGGLEMIVKTREQIGGPLNQFSTVGYKFEFGAKILYEDRMVRVESCSAYSTTDEANDTVI